MAAAACGWACPAAATPGGPPLRIGLAPYLPAPRLMLLFRPLREHLEAQLARAVQFYTARDFRQLAADTRARVFDAAMLPAHLAALAMSDWGYLPLSGTLAHTQVILLVRKDSPVQTAQDLRGQAIGTLDPLSLVAAVALRWLTEQGLALGTGAQAVRVAVQPTVSSALHALARGEVAAVAVAEAQLHNLSADTPIDHRRLVELRDIPGPVFVASPTLPDVQRLALVRALLSFQPDPAAALTAANTRHHALEPTALANLQAYVQVARRLMSEPTGTAR
ncbi:MAG: phosphate/phosphite/phosphonate ABC transporter substrate-binding protein [Caldimonas sp.]